MILKGFNLAALKHTACWFFFDVLSSPQFSMLPKFVKTLTELICPIPSSALQSPALPSLKAFARLSLQFPSCVLILTKLQKPFPQTHFPCLNAAHRLLLQGGRQDSGLPCHCCLPSQKYDSEMLHTISLSLTKGYIPPLQRATDLHRVMSKHNSVSKLSRSMSCVTVQTVQLRFMFHAGPPPQPHLTFIRLKYCCQGKEDSLSLTPWSLPRLPWRLCALVALAGHRGEGPRDTGRLRRSMQDPAPRASSTRGSQLPVRHVQLVLGGR